MPPHALRTAVTARPAAITDATDYIKGQAQKEEETAVPSDHDTMLTLCTGVDSLADATPVTAQAVILQRQEAHWLTTSGDSS